MSAPLSGRIGREKMCPEYTEERLIAYGGKTWWCHSFQCGTSPCPDCLKKMRGEDQFDGYELFSRPPRKKAEPREEAS